MNNLVFSAMHLVVDCLCISCIFSMAGSMPPRELLLTILAYNFLAFVSQPLTGLLLDISKRQKVYLSSVALLMASGAWCSQVHELCFLSVILLGMGNSMFHVSAGRYVTLSSGNDPKWLGIFVSTGAVGLAIGGAFFSGYLILALAVCLSFLVGVAIYKGEVPAVMPKVRNSHITYSWSSNTSWIILSGISLVVFTRSFYTTFVSHEGMSMVMLCVAATMGKALGGYFSQWFGLRNVLYFSLIMAGAVSLFFGNCDALVYLAVFLASLTMPLTLYLSNRYFSGNEGFSFGLLAAILFPGFFLAKALQGTYIADIISQTLIPTIVIEAIVLLLLRESRARVMIISFVGNVITNVPLNIFIRNYHPSYCSVIGLEFLVVIIEALLYYLVLRKCSKSLTYSLACNTTSFVVGLLLGL